MAGLLTAGILSAAFPAAAGESLKDAMKDGKFYLDARYRYEFVDQSGLPKDANASTLRTRLGYETGEFYHVQGVLEFENVTQIGNDPYNDTINGRADRPVVSDVESTEVNQAYLQYSGIPETTVKGGRQVMTLDNHRFIGDVGWRQNNQTFDAVRINNASLPDTTATYAYISTVNRIFGDDSPVGEWDSDSHIFHVSYAGLPVGKIAGYGYFLDFEEDSPANASRTFGISLDGKHALNDEIAAKYLLEFARQSDHANNPVDYDASYYHIAPALIWKSLTGTIGYEVLGSDSGAKGFVTPLATLHKFNGWADKFLTTPADGLEDFYLDLTWKAADLTGSLEHLNGLLAAFQFHDFNADKGSADYGNEWGIYVKKPVMENVYVEAKYADYAADTFATDTRKFILGIGVTY